jgi:hypothetical protein
MHATRLDQYPRDAKYEQDTYDPSSDVTEIDEMPNRIYWKPICDNIDPIDNQLKYILMEQDILINNLLTMKELGLLKGVRATSDFLNQKDLSRSAQILIDAIECYGSIEIYTKDLE